MAIKKWVSTDGDLTASTSWLPTGTPTDDDSLIFTKDVHTAITTNVGGLTGIDLALVWIQPGNRTQFGSGGNPVTIGTHKAFIQGSGAVYVDIETHATLDEEWVVDSGNFSAGLVVESGTATHIHCRNGYTDIQAGGFDLINVSGRNTVLDVGASATIGAFLQSGGSTQTLAHLSSAGLPCIINGGTVEYLTSGGAGTWSAAVFNIRGRLIWNGASEPSGTTQFVVDGGILDLSQDARAKTVEGPVIVQGGGEVLVHDNITLSNLINLNEDIPAIE